jgi:hypothetical protein
MQVSKLVLHAPGVQAEREETAGKLDEARQQLAAAGAAAERAAADASAQRSAAEAAALEAKAAELASLRAQLERYPLGYAGDTSTLLFSDIPNWGDPREQHQVNDGSGCAKY